MFVLFFWKKIGEGQLKGKSVIGVIHSLDEKSFCTIATISSIAYHSDYDDLSNKKLKISLNAFYLALLASNPITHDTANCRSK